MAERSEIIDRLTDVARAELGLAEDVELTPDTDIREVAWVDSVRLMTYVEAVESAFAIEFDIEQLSGEVVTNVGKLSDLVAEKVGR